MKRLRFLLWLVAGPVAVLIAVLAVAHPYLAVTEKSGGDVLAVEGWLEKPQMQQAAQLALGGGYRTVYTMGSIRPFAYYLRTHECLDITLREAARGEIAINVSGVTNAGFLLIADGDTVLREAVTPGNTTFTHRAADPLRSLRIVSTNSGQVDFGTDNIFILFLNINGSNAHLLQERIELVRLHGEREEAWPTFAHSARAALIEAGVPADRVIAVPAWGRPDSRSWANASHLAARLKEDGVTVVDLVSLGVHARRSRERARTACGDGVNVGVISIPDPLCAKGDWWKHWTGWFRLTKEVIGSPEPYAAELSQ